MNPPENGAFRSVVKQRCRRRAIKQLAADIEQIAEEVIDALAGREECDFVTDVSAKLPLAVIAQMFGIPRADWDMMFRLSNTMIGPSDPEYAGGETIKEVIEKARLEFFQYFTQLVEDRRRHPQDDLASALANGSPNGDPLPPFDLLSYFCLLIIPSNQNPPNAPTP